MKISTPLFKKYLFAVMIICNSPIVAIPVTFYNDAFHLIADDPQTRLPITVTIDWGSSLCTGTNLSTFTLSYQISNHSNVIQVKEGCPLFKQITMQLHGIGAGQGYIYKYYYDHVISNTGQIINNYKFTPNDTFDYHIEWVSDPKHGDGGYPKVWGNIRNNSEGKFLHLPIKIYQNMPA